MLSKRVEVSVVIPTYREAINLSVLVPRLAATLRAAGLDAEIIVVDDFSNDGTDSLCAGLSRKFPVRLLRAAEERGLGSAVVLGLQQARGDILVVMDADMSHPPEMVPKLVSACRSPFVDFVIGSRYTEGGSVDRAWPWYRRLNSRVASLLARGLTNAGDPLAGFFAIKKSTLRTDSLKPFGYKIGLDIIVRCDIRRIVEVPIAFRDRVFGESNLTLVQQWQYIRHLASLYQAKFAGVIQLICFGLIGLSGSIVDLTLFTLLLLWLPLTISRVAAIACATIWNFAWNRRVTFRSATSAPVQRLVKYSGATLVGAAINCATTIALCASVHLFTTTPMLAAAIGTAAGGVANFVLCRQWVFHEHRAVSLVAGHSTPPAAAASLRQVA